MSLVRPVTDRTVVLADDQPVILGGLHVVLDPIPDLQVVAEARSGESAVREVRRHGADVLVLDIAMDGNNGVATIREVLLAAPNVTVLVFAASTEDDALLAAIRAGARGYIYKDAEPADIVRAVRGVAAGEAVFGPGIADRLRALLDTPGLHRYPFPDLTAREREVLEMIAVGMLNSAIAMRLSLARKTVGNHVSAIFTRLGVPDRHAAIVRARTAGIGRGARL